MGAPAKPPLESGPIVPVVTAATAEESDTELTAPPRPRPLPPALRLFVGVSLAIFVPTWTAAIATIPTRSRYPMLLPFLDDGNPFFDFWIFNYRFTHLHTPRFFAPSEFHFSYFAAGVPLYSAFYQYGIEVALDLYFALCSGTMVVAAVLFGRALVQAGLRVRCAVLLMVVSLVCAFPAIFAFERGNLELLLAAGVTCGVWAFCTGRRACKAGPRTLGAGPRALAAVTWGVFGAVKLYPLLLAGLFLARLRWIGYLLLTLATAAVVTLLSLVWIGPSFAMARAGLQNGTAQFLADYTLALRATEWDHSLFAVVKVYAVDHGYALAPLLMPYFLIAGVTMLLVYCLRLRRLPLANQIVALSVCMVLLPPTSFEYTLTEMYGAWGVLVWLAVRSAAESREVAGLRAALGLLAVLFSPLRLVMWHGVSYGGQLQCVLLVALLGIALRQPWPALPVECSDAAAPAIESNTAWLDTAGAGASL